MAINVHVFKCSGPPVAAPTLEGQHWVDTVSKQIYLSVGISSVNDWILVNSSDTIITDSIASTSSTELDITPFNQLCVIKYIVCVYSAAEDKYNSFEMLGSKQSSLDVSNTKYAILGTNLDVDFDFVKVGTDVKLIGTNNETFSVDIRIHKNIL